MSFPVVAISEGQSTEENTLTSRVNNIIMLMCKHTWTQ